VIESLRMGLNSDPSIPAIVAARTALRDKSYRRLTEQFMKEEKRILSKAISRMPGLVFYDSDTNIFLLKAADLGLEIAGKAARAGLAVELCSDIDGLNGQFLRISVMKHDHNLKLIKLLNQISLEEAKKKSGAD
jgi:histidinol-phosphate/aromatic aminotransferase/cobyric acid decarboxylase-like protein